MFSEPPPEEPDDDAFNEIMEELTPLQQRLRKMPGVAFGAGVQSVTVLGALLAWFITPPIGRVAAVASLIGGGTAGRRVGKRLETARRGLVPAAIADMVNEDGIGGLRPKDVAALAKRYKVGPEEFEAQLSGVYARYLRQLLSEEEGVSLRLIQELAALRRGMGLRWNATQAAHVSEARAFLDGEAPPGESSLPSELRSLIWLTDTLFATSKNQASAAELTEALGLDDASSQRVVNALSKPIYGRAVARACGKYNRTEAPAILQTARAALCVTEDAARQVHAEMYEAQLGMLLPEGSEDATLGEEQMELLGELEGILQLRGAGAQLRKRTEPLYAAAASAALAEVLAGDAPKAVGVWGRLALRQQQLNLPTGSALDLLSVESRRLAAEALEEAAAKLGSGQKDEALALATRVLDYASFFGEMLAVSGVEGASATAADLAARYLGALSLPTADAPAAEELASALAAANPDSAGLAAALFAMTDPALATARAEYTATLEKCVSAGTFDEAVGAANRNAASSAGLAPRLAQQLGRDVYYGWLTDVAEKGQRSQLEDAAAVRGALGVSTAAVAELHAATDIDELVLSACCEQLLAVASPLSGDDASWLQFLEGQLAARPGLAASVVAANGGGA